MEMTFDMKTMITVAGVIALISVDILNLLHLLAN